MARVGQFKKGGGRVGNGRTHTKHTKQPSHAPKQRRRRAATSKALTIVEKVPAPVVRIVRPRAAPQHAVTHYRHHSRPRAPSQSQIEQAIAEAHGVGEMVPGNFRLRSAAVAGAVGYADSGKGLGFLHDLLAKMPTIGKVPKEALVGLLANYFAGENEWYDALAQGMLDVGAYKFGQAGFSMSGDDDDW